MNSKNTLKIFGLIFGAILAVVILIVVGLFAVNKFAKDNEAIISYNQELVDQRNEIVDQIGKLSTAINEADTIEEVEKEIADYNAKVDEVENSINSIKVPNKSGELKDKNIEYIATARGAAQKAQEAVDKAKAGEDTTSIIKEYNEKIESLNDQNIEIAKLVNELVGYEAIKVE